MTSRPLTTPLVDTLQLLAPYEHLCSIYESEQEHLTVAAPFLRIGLERGERCLYVADDPTESAVRDAMHAEGIDLALAMENKSLVILSKEEAYLHQRSFDPNWMLKFWKEAASKALREGFSALRVAGETQWILKNKRGMNRWMEYESRLTHALEECRCVALCQYDRRLFPPEIIHDVIRTHPTVVYRATVSLNTNYVPPEEFLVSDRSAREVERLLTSLYERQQIDLALRQQRSKLRESEQLFRLMFDNIKDYAIFSLDTQGRVCSWNAGAESIQGFRKEEILGQHFSRFYIEEEIAQSQPKEQLKAAASNGQFEEEGWRVRKDGTRFWASILITALRDKDGKLIGFSKRIRDIPERRQEENLRRNEAYLAEGQKISHTGSWAWNASTRELYWSAEHFRIFGLDPVHVRPSYELALQMIHPEERALIEQRFQNAVRTCGDFDSEFRVVTPDGAIKYIHSLAHPAFNEAGELTEYVGTIMDVTERKLADEALRNAQSELVRVSRIMTMGELTASIAHEVNQPLAAVIANGNAGLHWLAGTEPSIDEARNALIRVIRDANRASEVVARIRALLKRTATDHRQWLDLNEVIEEVITLTRGELRKHEVVLRMELAEHLPRVLADRVQLQQVLLNLIMNSIEAMSGITPRLAELTIRTRKDDSRVLVEVRDSGTGLDEQSTTQVFEPFYTTKQQGMGIGLSISRSIVEMHSGSLWSESNDDFGASFKFTLPIQNPGIP